MDASITDELETEYGLSILSELCNQPITRNGQQVRATDQTKTSSEYAYLSDGRGKSYIQNYQTGTRLYPITAYAKVYNLTFNEAAIVLHKQYYRDGIPTDKTYIPRRIETSTPQIDYLPVELYQPCQKYYERNGLYEYLRFTYSVEAVNEAFTRYRLGTSRHWEYSGYLATCLPQFDKNDNLRQVKIMSFDAMNGRRIKKHQFALRWNLNTKSYEPIKPDTDKIYFAGKAIARRAGIKEPNLQQCFFGEHLLTEYPDSSVAIVEGESTAIVCSLLWPQYVWLATGGSMGGSWYSPERFSVLQGRNVTLWPDTGKYDDWTQKANQLRPLVISLYVSDYVEKNNPIGMSNIDLRDLLTRPYYLPRGESARLYGEVLTVDLPESHPFD